MVGMNTAIRHSATVRRLALVISLFFAVATTSIVRAVDYTALYAFGDSLSDLGNTYNEFGGSGADSAIYSELGYTSSLGRYDHGRWSNGKLWVEHLNEALGLPALARNRGSEPLLFGTNFAWAGSTSGTGYTDLILHNLQLQISLSGGTVPSTALYTVWSGGNDVIDYVQDSEPNTPAGIDAHTTMMADNISTALTTLYNAGARHIFAPNLPALGDKPSFVNTPNQAFANAIVTSYTPKLNQELMDFRTAHADAFIYSWDTYSQFSDMLTNPGSYGFTNTQQAAFDDSGAYPGTVVADPNTHVFWDSTHPTEAGHMILGQDAHLAITLLTVPEPSSVVLLSCALLLGCRRIRSQRA
jgi:phospholipase/lecithinase/hemolysin